MSDGNLKMTKFGVTRILSISGTKPSNDLGVLH